MKTSTKLATLLTIAVVASASSVRAQTNIAGEPYMAQPGGNGASYAGMVFDPTQADRFQPRAGSVFSQAVHGGQEVLVEPAPAHMGEAHMGHVVEHPHQPGEVLFGNGHPGDCGCGDGACGVACGDGACNLGCGDCNACGHCDGDGCDECVPLCLPRFKHLQLFAGVHGFRGPRDLGVSSNFGFQQGLMLTGKLPIFKRRCIGYQIGYQSVQSRLHGDVISGNTASRVQHFITAGVFKRRPVGLQYGIAWDYLRDDLFFDIEVTQIRADISIRGPRGGEFGFWGAFPLDEDVAGASGANSTTYETTEQYLVYYRWQLENCGEARLWGGFTDRDAGLFGGEFIMPMNDCFALQSGFHYLIPEEDALPDSAINEAWNLGINLVWYPRGNAKSSLSSPFRPLFNIGDNGSMIVRQQ